MRTGSAAFNRLGITFATFRASLEHDCVELHAVWDPDQAPLLAVGHAALLHAHSGELPLNRRSRVALEDNLLCG